MDDEEEMKRFLDVVLLHEKNRSSPTDEEIVLARRAWARVSANGITNERKAPTMDLYEHVFLTALSFPGHPSNVVAVARQIASQVVDRISEGVERNAHYGDDRFIRHVVASLHPSGHPTQIVTRAFAIAELVLSNQGDTVPPPPLASVVRKSIPQPKPPGVLSPPSPVERIPVNERVCKQCGKLWVAAAGYGVDGKVCIAAKVHLAMGGSNIPDAPPSAGGE